ncbi:MAG: polyprenyl diphosphate synthase [Opitutae bacterium]
MSADPSTPNASLPRHIGIIMDGNGRWAASRNLPRLEGHRRGAERIFDVVDECITLGIPTLTIFAFSVENWKRPAEEVSGLFKLGEIVLRANLARLLKRKVKLKVIGNLEEMPDFVKEPLKDALIKSKDNDVLTLVVALNYGARQEVALATRKIAEEVAAGKLKLDQINWTELEKHLETAGLPDPDLIIRTSGEARLSNFLLLQAAYAEIVITDTYWPDFTKEEFQKCLAVYAKRERRFGMTGAQVQPTKTP